MCVKEAASTGYFLAEYPGPPSGFSGTPDKDQHRGGKGGSWEIFLPLSFSFPNQSNVPITVTTTDVIIKATEHSCKLSFRSN